MTYQLRLNVNYFEPGAPKPIRLPGIVTEAGVLISHLRYLAANNNKSLSWKKKSVSAVILLLRYMDSFSSDKKNPLEILRLFSRCLSEGTIDYESMSDETGLHWKPRNNKSVADIIWHINKFTDHLNQKNSPSSLPPNPFREATSVEQRLNWCALKNKNNSIFLSHLSSNESLMEKSRSVREFMPGKSPFVSGPQKSTKKFAKDEFKMLIEKGFRYADGSYDYKSICMVALMHYGGLRISELFHIYLCDITEDPNIEDGAFVLCFHPELGSSPDPAYANRKEFLAAEYNLEPRNILVNRYHAGWKSPALKDSENLFFEVIFSSDEASKFFYDAWIKYLSLQRVDPPDCFRHPFLFTNNSGRPETIGNFRDKYARALEKVGLQNSKNLGTSPHGNRHAYGDKLDELGLSETDIQTCMHHKSLFSSAVYRQSSEAEIREKMRLINEK